MNPYRRSASLLYNRIKWDLRLESWRSRKKLKDIRDRNKGEKAVILCNGPSLNETDFSVLEDVYTFGLNKINLLFSKTNFRPSCIVAINKYVLEQNKEFYNKTDIPLYIRSEGIKLINKRNNITYLNFSQSREFNGDCSISIYSGKTVTYVALQLAFHMGFSKVALIGCDHNFSTKGPANKTVISGKTDPNHFDPNYFSGGVKWQLPDLNESEISYHLAKNAYYNDNRVLVNATVRGELEILPRMSLKNFLKD